MTKPQPTNFLGKVTYQVTLLIEADLDAFAKTLGATDRPFTYEDYEHKTRVGLIDRISLSGNSGMFRFIAEAQVDAVHGLCGLCGKVMEDDSMVSVNGDPAHETCANRWIKARIDARLLAEARKRTAG